MLKLSFQIHLGDQHLRKHWALLGTASQVAVPALSGLQCIVEASQRNEINWSTLPVGNGCPDLVTIDDSGYDHASPAHVDTFGHGTIPC